MEWPPSFNIHSEERKPTIVLCTMLKIKTTSSFEIEAEMSILKLLVITLLYRCSNIFQQAIYSLHPNQLDLFKSH